jgi:hypothetical protein
LLAAALFAMVSYASPPADDASSREDWLRAPQAQGQSWSREAALKRLATTTKFAGMTRPRIIDLLGAPGYASEDYYPGAGRTGRIDVYRLSSKNNRSFRIDYNSSDRATGDFIEQEPCGCDSCNSHAPAVPLRILTTTILKKDAAKQGQTITIPQLETLLGRSGQRSFLQQVVGGRVWVDYTDVWSIAGSEHRFLIASGHQPSGEPTGDSPFGSLGGMPVDSWSLIYMAPGCLAPVSAVEPH